MKAYTLTLILLATKHPIRQCELTSLSANNSFVPDQFFEFKATNSTYTMMKDCKAKKWATMLIL